MLCPKYILKASGDGGHHIPEDVVAVIILVAKKIVSFIKIKTSPVQLIPVAPCLISMAPCEENLCHLGSWIVSAGML